MLINIMYYWISERFLHYLQTYSFPMSSARDILLCPTLAASQYHGGRGAEAARSNGILDHAWGCTSSWMHKNHTKSLDFSEIPLILPWKVRAVHALCRSAPQVPISALKVPYGTCYNEADSRYISTFRGPVFWSI